MYGTFPTFWNTRLLFFSFFFSTYSQPGPSFNTLFVQSGLPPFRPLRGEAPGRDSNPGRVDLLAGTLITRPPHLTVDQRTSLYFSVSVEARILIHIWQASLWIF